MEVCERGGEVCETVPDECFGDAAPAGGEERGELRQVPSVGVVLPYMYFREGGVGVE